MSRRATGRRVSMSRLGVWQRRKPVDAQEYLTELSRVNRNGFGFLLA